MPCMLSEPVGAVQGGGGGVEGWQDVGGLADVRAALQQALELPTKYASLIARLPLLDCSALHLHHPHLPVVTPT